MPRPTSAYRRPSRKLAYTADEFREVLTKLYGPLADWDLAGAAVEDLGLAQYTIHRYLRGRSHPIGSTVLLTERLLAEQKSKRKKTEHTP